ncbi:Synaptosomal-associated protein [Dirofilaria immitis]
MKDLTLGLDIDVNEEVKILDQIIFLIYDQLELKKATERIRNEALCLRHKFAYNLLIKLHYSICFGTPISYALWCIKSSC